MEQKILSNLWYCPDIFTNGRKSPNEWNATKATSKKHISLLIDKTTNEI